MILCTETFLSPNSKNSKLSVKTFLNAHFKKTELSKFKLIFVLLTLFSTSGFAKSENLKEPPGPIGLSISTHPTNKTACVGSQVLFSIVATNATTYVWQIDTGGGFADLPITGLYSLISNNLVASGVTSDMDGYKYRCIVGDANSSTVTSNQAILTLSTSRFYGQPLDKTVLVGGTTSIKVNAYYSTNYKWQVKAGSGSEFTDIVNGAPYSISGDNSTSTLTITGATAQMNGYSYRSIANNSCPLTATSNAATLTVSAGPSITSQPVATNVCLGGATQFAVVASNATSYTWQVRKSSSWENLSNSGPYTGTVSSILNITGATAIMDGYQYRVIVYGAASSSLTSDPFALTVDKNAVIDDEPVAAKSCEGHNASFSVVASNAISYQWQTDNGSGFEDISVSAPYSGATTSQLTLTGLTVDMDNAKYRCVVTGSCDSQDISTEVILTVSVPGVWLGAESSEWNNTANWSCGIIPTESTDVLIGASASEMPDIDFVYDAKCRNLTIEENATLKISGALLEITGNVTNNGTFDRGGPVLFSGDQQVIPSGAYFDLAISGDGLKKLEGDIFVASFLSLGGGHIELGSHNLTLGAAGEAIVDKEGSFVVTNGTGRLVREGIGGSNSGAILFPVGSSTDSYTPVTIANSGTSDSYGVRVITGVYSTYNAQDEPIGNALTEDNVKKTWFVNETTTGGSNVKLTFMWSDLDQQPGFNSSTSFASHYTNGKWNASAASEAGLDAQWYTSLEGVTTFSPFGVGSNNSPLPLTLLSFKAVKNEGQLSLKWETANEINTSGFEIESSRDARNFSKIGYVSAYNQSEMKPAYSFNVAQSGISTASYYRLKMLDADGSFAYSKIANVVRGDVADNYTIYPNPAVSENLTLQSVNPEESLDLTVVDMLGVVLYEAKKVTNGNNLSQIPIKQLPGNANYILRITTLEGVKHLKFFKK